MPRLSVRKSKDKLEAGANAAKAVWASGLAVSSTTVAAFEEGDEGGLKDLLDALDYSRAEDPEATVPKRWVEYCGGDENKARRRWRAMATYREAHAMDDMLRREQKEFFRIKKLYPQFWLGQDAQGNLVTLELLRDTREIVSLLRRSGISAERFARHQSFLTEYWIHQNLSRTGQMVRIIDVQDTPILAQSLGSVRQYFGATSIAMYHYPGLTAKIYFVNVSRAFRIIWSLMANFLDERTRESVHLLNSPLELPEDLMPDVFMGELSRDLEHSVMPGGSADDHEPAVLYDKDSFLAALPGSWTEISIESPMSRMLSGNYDGTFEESDDEEDDKVPDPEVRLDLVERPVFLVDSSCTPCLRFTCKFSNGDVLTIHHGIHRFSKDKKVTNIKYKPRFGDSAPSCLLVMRKTST
ncbi:Phosphatidylinositol/phosphatidylcholine transfer protein SFH3 [Hondaea fermentalgiana]|uniref:Phosphatidylinositol/phosphatidylcholine transfer protein SFH3 n=1 Tax=Hondaea fermentalgiana TaxID=2315210 RepID=A0A2R5GB95_9STRA|nr:Phosphatidylinositol/phosphatidylcholine transfer protein SFH3 [Hondaea fermentalgiana]|eukprot:GBG27865.1 Phosphatidylinositol/phosphatidylcholine transfer protein SFH3 [Hondaea fermentalgiana]